MRVLLLLLSVVIFASPASAVTLKLGGPTPKATVYKPCETQVIVYDARPEMGISFSSETPNIAPLASIGVRVARVSLDINALEPTSRPGLYDSAYLAKSDQLVEDCRQQGVCLYVALKGNPALGDSNSQVTAPQDRLARLVADIAARYPSVLYWEIGEGMYEGLGDGKTVSSLLKALYPAVKAANPVAQISCAVRSDKLLQAVYEDGAQKSFDLVCAITDAKGFSDDAIALRKVMAAGEDMSKPLWCVFESGFEQSLLEAAFAANNNAFLYAKVLVQKAKPDESWAWLADTRANAGILSKPSGLANVLVETKKPMVAVGYDSKAVDGGIEIQRVMIDSLVPTVIQLRFAAEPPPAAPAKPGAKPVESKPEIDPRHVPDPWDI